MIWLIIAAILIAIALLRVGVTAEYSDIGATVTGRVGFLKLKLYPAAKKKRTKKTKSERKERKAEKKKKDEQESGGKKPGSALDFKLIFGEVTKVLGKIKRRLLIKDLTVFYVQAGGDPFKMATTHGLALSALGLTQAALESFFRIKRYHFRTAVDFTAEDARIYVKATLSIAVWELISIGVAGLKLVLRAKKKPAAVTVETEKAPEEIKS